MLHSLTSLILWIIFQRIQIQQSYLSGKDSVMKVAFCLLLFSPEMLGKWKFVDHIFWDCFQPVWELPDDLRLDFEKQNIVIFKGARRYSVLFLTAR